MAIIANQDQEQNQNQNENQKQDLTLSLLPLRFFYKYIHDKYGVDYAYALHFSTNMTILSISLVSFVVMGNEI
jgi:hypothetical protein